jgi:hypothetical protein
MTISKPRVILWDIETVGNVLHAHSLRTDGSPIYYGNILSERYIVCGSWKELSTGKAKSVSVLDNPASLVGTYDFKDDYYVVKKLHEVLSGVDAIIHHHGDRFDLPRLNARIIYHGLTPLPPIVTIDTLKLARKTFDFNSNRLDYLGRFLGVGNKIKTDNDLWLECLRGDEKAIRRMVKYNVQDVLLLERVYNKLAPYVPARINRALYGSMVTCPNCGVNDVQRRGDALTKGGLKPRYSCNACSSWSTGSIIKGTAPKLRQG